jgi:hypothetical protein
MLIIHCGWIAFLPSSNSLPTTKNTSWFPAHNGECQNTCPTIMKNVNVITTHVCNYVLVYVTSFFSTTQDAWLCLTKWGICDKHIYIIMICLIIISNWVVKLHLSVIDLDTFHTLATLLLHLRLYVMGTGPHVDHCCRKSFYRWHAFNNLAKLLDLKILTIMLYVVFRKISYHILTP